MRKCRTISGLLRALSQGKSAQLTVYASSHNTDNGAWAETDTEVTLNLGGGRYARISHETFDRIKGHLAIQPV